MRTLIFIIMLMLGAMMGLPQGALAASNASDADLSDSRIKILMYDEKDVYTVTTRYGYQTNIVFAPNEEIETISVGDRSPWQLIPSGNRIFIRPMQEGVITNMTVLTNKHSYQFDLKSLAADKTEGNIYVAQFTYPDTKKKVAPIAPPAPFMSAAPTGMAGAMATPPAYITAAAPITGPNYNYTYSGSDALAPLQVYDDGKLTYIKYQTMPEPMPSVYTADPMGNETPANYTMRDNSLVIEALSGEIILKNKDGSVHIFNENLSPR